MSSRLQLRLFLACAIALIATATPGFGSPGEANFKFPAGISPDEVVARVGWPDGRASAGGREVWIYARYRLVFEEGKLEAVYPLKAARGKAARMVESTPVVTTPASSNPAAAGPSPAVTAQTLDLPGTARAGVTAAGTGSEPGLEGTIAADREREVAATARAPRSNASASLSADEALIDTLILLRKAMVRLMLLLVPIGIASVVFLRIRAHVRRRSMSRQPAPPPIPRETSDRRDA